MPDQPSPKPTRKVTAGALGGALATFGWGMAKLLWGVDPEPALVASSTTIAAFLCGYITTE